MQAEQTTLLESKTFADVDQARFAAWSGDYNPIHIDPEAARSTLAGAPVVHGVHLLLWGLEGVLARYPNLPRPQSCQARFDRFCLLHQLVGVHLAALRKDGVRFEVRASRMRLASFEFTFGDCGDAERNGCDWPIVPVPASPRAWRLSELPGQAGRLRPWTSLPLNHACFPRASGWLGAARVGALGAVTMLVGMVCPGLESILSRTTLSFEAGGQEDGLLAYEVVDVDARFGLVRLAIAGLGVRGGVSCLTARSSVPAREPAIFGGREQPALPATAALG